jgi:predicted secreted protein
MASAFAFLSALGIAGAMAARSASPGTAAEKVIVTVTAPMSAAKPVPVAAPVGSTFTIDLASNQTTGYSWRLVKAPSKAVLVSLGSTFAGPTEGRLGMGGIETWTFRAIGAGKVTLVLEYVRPWEKGTKPAKTQAFVVSVS